jgi:hypothetical protein
MKLRVALVMAEIGAVAADEIVDDADLKPAIEK